MVFCTKLINPQVIEPCSLAKMYNVYTGKLSWHGGIAFDHLFSKLIRSHEFVAL